MSEKWQTQISEVSADKIIIRGYKVEELMGRVSFAGTVYLLLKGELPKPYEEKVMDAILVSLVDQGVTPPSTMVTRTLAGCGEELTPALAGGILAVSRFHGGAIEDCMKKLLAAKKNLREKTLSHRQAGEEIFSELSAKKQRMPGFGDNLPDPRGIRLLALAKTQGIYGDCFQIAEELDKVLEHKMGKRLPLNLEGAIAVLLCEMDFPPECANAFFVLSRLAGLTAHYLEEKSQYNSLRKIDPDNCEYTGPSHRQVP